MYLWLPDISRNGIILYLFFKVFLYAITIINISRKGVCYIFNVMRNMCTIQFINCST
jgi:hypothetical protein